MTLQLHASIRWVTRAVAAPAVVVMLLAAPVLAQETGTGTIDPTSGAPGDSITVSGRCPEGPSSPYGWARWTWVAPGTSWFQGPGWRVEPDTQTFSGEGAVPVLPAGQYKVTLYCMGQPNVGHGVVPVAVGAVIFTVAGPSSTEATTETTQPETTRPETVPAAPARAAARFTG